MGVFFASPSPEQYQEKHSLFEEINVHEAVESLKQDGYYLGLHLPPKILQEIINYVDSAPIQARTYLNLRFL